MIKLSSLTGRPAHLGGCYHCKGGTKMCICPGQQSKPETPELFAEYRDGGDPGNCVWCGLHWSKHQHECGFKDAARKLPPGPAWIPSNSAHDHPAQRRWSKVPEGYTWRPSTESTGAGWVRPRESV